MPILSVAGAPVATLSWAAAPRADMYDVVRGAAGGWPASDYGACLRDDFAANALEGADSPDAGAAFFYLVRGVDSGCGGAGSYGASSSGAERINSNPAACPPLRLTFTGTGGAGAAEASAPARSFAEVRAPRTTAMAR